jgi:hypothetical protein
VFARLLRGSNGQLAGSYCPLGSLGYEGGSVMKVTPVQEWGQPNREASGMEVVISRNHRHGPGVQCTSKLQTCLILGHAGPRACDTNSSRPL